MLEGVFVGGGEPADEGEVPEFFSDAFVEHDEFEDVFDKGVDDSDDGFHVGNDNVGPVDCLFAEYCG